MQADVNDGANFSGVIGEPVLHSKSPLIQNTMLAALGLDYVYLCQPVPRGRCREWLECAKFAGYAGFNATMPHKEELVELMDELDGDARLFGAVNTVCIRDGRAYGYNTDGAGFLRALNDEGIDPAGKRVLVLGAGGAAKAVCLKLAQAGAEGKLARYLLANGQGGSVTCTASGLAQRLGISRASLYRAFGALENSTLIVRRGKTILIPDLAALESVL